MTTRMSGSTLWRGGVSAVLASAVLACGSPRSALAAAAASWESAIANIPRPNVSGRTVRQFARIAVGGSRLRVRISNESGTDPLTVADAHAALPGSDPGSVLSASDRTITFNGGGTITVAPGAAVLSDAVDMPVQPLTRLAVSAFFRTASRVQVGHLLASETNYIALGDHAAEVSMAGAVPSTSGFYLGGISVSTGNPGAGVVACLGDSITDGLYSTTDGERRYPDRLAERLLRDSRGRIGAIDAGLVGNGLLGGAALSEGGQSALARLSRDVLGRAGVHWLILFEGINDIIYPPDAGDTAAELIAAYQQVIAQAHEAGVQVFGATLTPYAGSGPAYYSAAKEAVRQRVNAWIRGSGAYDGVLDFDAVVRNPSEPARLRPAYDGGDHLHLSDAGYAAIADAIPLGPFLR